MEDLIISICVDESNKQKKLIIETLVGRIRLLKSKKYSGPLKKINIDEHDEFKNLNYEILNKLKEFLNKVGNIQISQSIYIIDENNLIEFFDSYIKYNLIFYRKKKSPMFILEKMKENIYSTKLVKISELKMKIKIIYKDESYSVDNLASYIIVGVKSFILQNNCIYWIDRLLNEELINKLISNKFQITNSQKEQYKYIYIESISQSEKKIENKYLINLSAFLYLELYNNEILGTLTFKYLNKEFEYKDKKISFEIEGKTYFRNYKKEQEIADVLLSQNWEKFNESKLKYTGKDISKDIDELINNEIGVLTQKKQNIYTNKFQTFSMSYGIDWFELNGTIRTEDNVYSLADIRKLKGKQWIEVDDGVIILPKVISDYKDIIEESNKKLFIKKRNIGNALNIAKKLNINKIVNIEKINEYRNIELNIPSNLNRILRDYQKAGVKWLIYLYKNNFGGCLADDMGLGKTLQVITMCSDEIVRKENLLSLIIVPKTLILNWKREFEKFNDKLRVVIYHGSNRDFKDVFNKKKNDIVLTTYGTVLNDIDKLKCITYNCIVMDEAQNIKNSYSKTYVAITKLISKVKIVLTGTPIENNVLELWALMDLVNRGVLGSKKDFLKKYSKGDIDLQELNLIVSPFLLRRIKSNVLNELPDKIEQTIYCTMGEEQKQLYDNMLQMVKNEINRSSERYEIKSNAIILQGLLYLRQVCCHPRLLNKDYNINNCYKSSKFEVLKELVEEIYSRKNKIVIFSQYTKMLTIIKRFLNTKGYKYFYLDGKTNNRQKVVDEFEQSIEGVFLISMKAGGVGLNLTSANYAIIYDPWWNPAIENQAADRIYRIGQKRNVTIFRLVTIDTIEEKIAKLKLEKMNISNKILNNQDNINTINMELIKKLLE